MYILFYICAYLGIRTVEEVEAVDGSQETLSAEVSNFLTVVEAVNSAVNYVKWNGTWKTCNHSVKIFTYHMFLLFIELLMRFKSLEKIELLR